MRHMVIALITLLAGLASEVFAAEIYKYKDENGQWVFTDKEPVNEQAETIQVKSGSQASAEPEVLAERIGGQNVLRVVNPLSASIEAELISPVFGDQPRKQVIAGGSTETLYQGTEAIPEFLFRWTLGDPAARQDSYAYRLPVPANGSYRISQAFNGGFSHGQQPSRYAVDFEMPVGTDIVAARDGVVILIRDDYSFGGKSEYFLDKANHVMIFHADGTYAIYAHILQGSVTVDPGDRVSAGQRIARSGSSGFSTGPHLHFALLRNSNSKLVSVPFMFRDSKGKAFTPLPGMEVDGR